MLKVKVDIKNYTVTMRGHADFAENGKDIVCAGASTLLYTLANTLEEFRTAMTESPSFTINGEGEKQRVTYRCKPNEEYEPNVQLVFMTVTTGFNLLAENYPNNIKLTVI